MNSFTNIVVFKCVFVFVIFIYFVNCATASSEVSNVYGNPNKKQSWPKCKSHIFCEGELLHDVQLMHLFKDSKIFVDFKLKYTEKEIIEKYKELKHKENGIVSRAKLKKFVEDNFERGNELEPWVPQDWKKEPSIIEKIEDPQFKKWALFLNTMWRVLSRRVKDEVETNPKLYSLIYVPNGFIIPGGRFTELYYWDTYWIINGLLLCDMKDTAKGIIENLLHLVKLFGHVPNGSRIYYISRSQPPLLIQMANNYYKETDDWNLIKDNIKYFDNEFKYWWDNHMVNLEKGGKILKLARYFSYDMSPRPESYREDYLVAHELKDLDRQQEFYIKIRSAAETGWDFSSRWFVKDKTNQGNLSDVAAPQILPVDLNSFLQSNALLLSEWYAKLGDKGKSSYFKKISDSLLEAITEVLWHEDLGIWLDYDCVNKVRRNYFYTSNLAPLYTHSYYKTWSRSVLSDKIISYLRNNQIEQFIGGVPTSLDETGEQWDFPNAWAPLQGLLIDGLDRLGTDESRQEAFRLANKWLQSNYKGYTEQHTMFEKYDVLRPGETGEGGEYVPQTGFGWTNGVILELLAKYGDCMEAENPSHERLDSYNLPREKKCRAFRSHLETNDIEQLERSLKSLFISLDQDPTATI